MDGKVLEMGNERMFGWELATLGQVGLGMRVHSCRLVVAWQGKRFFGVAQIISV